MIKGLKVIVKTQLRKSSKCLPQGNLNMPATKARDANACSSLDPQRVT